MINVKSGTAYSYLIKKCRKERKYQFMKLIKNNRKNPIRMQEVNQYVKINYMGAKFFR